MMEHIETIDETYQIVAVTSSPDGDHWLSWISWGNPQKGMIAESIHTTKDEAIEAKKDYYRQNKTDLLVRLFWVKGREWGHAPPQLRGYPHPPPRVG